MKVFKIVPNSPRSVSWNNSVPITANISDEEFRKENNTRVKIVKYWAKPSIHVYTDNPTSTPELDEMKRNKTKYTMDPGICFLMKINK